MTDVTDLAKVDSFTKPATILIEKISDAVGGIFKPYQMIRVAKASAEVEKIQAKTQIEITDIQQRALQRFLVEESKKQSNIEAITSIAIEHLDDKSMPQNVADDWITNFFDKSRIVSDSQMQTIWARVLAGEANRPGAFSKKTVNLLGDLDKIDAELFLNLGGFCWQIWDIIPLVFDVNDSIYNQRGINFSSLSHLDSLGLVHFDDVLGYARFGLPKTVIANYYESSATLTLPKEEENNLQIGKVRLTRAGHELAMICDSKPVEGFYDYVCGVWESQGLVPKR